MQMSAVSSPRSRWLPEGNLWLLIQPSTLSQSKTLVIFFISLLSSLVHTSCCSQNFWWRGKSYFFVMLMWVCLLTSVRILAWGDENTLWPPLSSMLILEYVLTLFHFSYKEIWYVKDHSYYSNIGTSYKPNERFIRKSCANRTLKSQWNHFLTNNEERAWKEPQKEVCYNGICQHPQSRICRTLPVYPNLHWCTQLVQALALL